MSDNGYIDAPLVRFCLERLLPDPSGKHRNLLRPFLGIGDFVSMPSLVSADGHAHERYQHDRLFTLTGIGPGSRVEIAVTDKQLELFPNQPITVHRPGGDIRVTLIGFSSKSVLHALEKLH